MSNAGRPGLKRDADLWGVICENEVFRLNPEQQRWRFLWRRAQTKENSTTDQNPSFGTSLWLGACIDYSRTAFANQYVFAKPNTYREALRGSCQQPTSDVIGRRRFELRTICAIKYGGLIKMYLAGWTGSEVYAIEVVARPVAHVLRPTAELRR